MFAISSMISLLTNIDPNKACSASRFEGCFLFILLSDSLIFSIFVIIV